MAELRIGARGSGQRPKFAKAAAALLEMCREFYADPENERAYQAWKAERSGKCGCQGADGDGDQARKRIPDGQNYLQYRPAVEFESMGRMENAEPGKRGNGGRENRRGALAV